MLRTTPVSHVAGVGQAKQKLLTEIGVHTVHDLLHYFPRRYEDRSVQPFESFADGARVTAHAVVEGISKIRWQARKAILSAQLRVDQRHLITGVWFNQPYLKEKLVDGRVVTITGKYDAKRHTMVISHTEFSSPTPSGSGMQWVPVYGVVHGVTSGQLQKLILQALKQFGDQLDDVLPMELVQKYRLCSHAQAVSSMHQPKTSESMRQAHRRLAFEEFFLFQLGLQWFRKERDKAVSGIARQFPATAFSDFQSALPFSLTDDQVTACNDIEVDLRSAKPMSRLLQGDVGSGKTWVALWASYAMYHSGSQTALMAPTEILAEQHYEEAKMRLEPLGMTVRLLTGSTADGERRNLIQDLSHGDIHLLIGTHALLTEDVIFSNLGLVITDEQHRFGVEQRQVLRAKGKRTDALFLSATPIPRTLALAIYGDLDVSSLRQMPSGRKPIVTRQFSMREEDKVMRFLRKELAKGRQAYLVAPLVEESEQLDMESATELASRLEGLLAGYKVGLLHGRMSPRDKERVMKSFVQQELGALVSTTVIEVGINVPNATVMVIYHAERFGLAQLHQLRGRVGRGSEQSYCVLLSNASTDVAKRRLETMVETTDGFVIAERDLELRGPGEFLGVRQSGLPEFTVGDLSKDFKMMEVARDEAVSYIESTEFWLLPKYEKLRHAVKNGEIQALRNA